jgi:hypothetical protein
MTIQEETDTTTMQENNAQIDVEVGIDGGAAEPMGTKEETASTAENETNPSERSSRQMSKKMMSKLASSDDPFAIREGKTLLWTNVNMVLVSQSSTMMKYHTDDRHFKMEASSALLSKVYV